MSAPESTMTDGPTLHVDLGAIARNHRTLRAWRAGTEVAAVVKSDAYGAGLAPVARALDQAGCTTFFVANLAEGSALRAVLSDAVIYVLDGPAPGEDPMFLNERLRPVLNSVSQAERWAHATHASNAPAALHIDTGMNRLGLRPEETPAVAALLPDVDLVMTHFACAEEDVAMNARQAAAFETAAGLWPQARLSLANSEGHIGRLGGREDLARVGLAHFGARLGPRPGPALEPALALDAPIVQVRSVAGGETIGYGAATRAEAPMKLAVAAIGYGHGLPRNTDVCGVGRLGGATSPVLGRVSMDLTIFRIPESAASTVAEGDRVTIFGEGLPMEEAAAAFARTPYELCAGLTARVARTYDGAKA